MTFTNASVVGSISSWLLTLNSGQTSFKKRKSNCPVTLSLIECFTSERLSTIPSESSSPPIETISS